MNAGFIATKLVAAAVVPPLNLILLGLLGLALCRRKPKTGRMLIVLSFLLLAALSTAAGVRLLAIPLERMTVPLRQPAQTGAQAIVVLGGGRTVGSPAEGIEDSLGDASLRRVAYAAKLHRATGLPLLVSGGAPDSMSGAEAATMAQVLHDSFGLDTQWVEDKSLNTADNARLSAAMLLPQGKRRILLITDAVHMPRARRVFVQAGFDVVTAPTAFSGREPLGLLAFIPRADNLGESYRALWEWVGLAWYAVRYRA